MYRREQICERFGAIVVNTTRISGLVVEYIVAIDVTRARFPADAYAFDCVCFVFARDILRIFCLQGAGAARGSNENAASEDRTHDLRIMRPTRYQLRYCRYAIALRSVLDSVADIVAKMQIRYDSKCPHQESQPKRDVLTTR